MNRKGRKQRRGIGSGLLAGLILAGVASTASATSLEEAINLAIATSPDIGIVAHNREAIEEELRQSRGLYLPQVDVTAGMGVARFNNRTTRNDGDAVDSRTDTVQESRLIVQQRVFDGFEADSLIARDKARVQSAARRVFENAEFTTLDAIGAYLEVLRQRELVRLAEENVQVHMVILGFLQEQLAGGAGAGADVAQTQARLSRARATLANTNNELRNGESRYARLIGQYPDDLVMPEFPEGVLPPDLDAALEDTWRNNPTMKIFDADVRASEAGIGVAEVPLWPSLSLEGESEYNNNQDGTDTWEFNSGIYLRMRWNLFRGGIDTAARQEAVARVFQSKDERQRAFVDAEEEMRRSWFAHEANVTAVTQLTDAAQYSSETRDAYRQQFEVGQRSLLDVLDSENELFVARGLLTTAQVNELLSKYRILAVAGRLMSTLGIAPPEQSHYQDEGWISGLFD
jgi:adhesin transport system outer membrane protein